MKLDMSLLHQFDSPIWNEMVDGYFKEMPVYVNSERMRVHRKKFHVQPGLEINVTHQGQAAVVLGHDIYVQSSRQLILFPGSIPHQIFPDETTHFRRSVICLNEETLRSALDEQTVAMLKSNQTCLQLRLPTETYTRVSSLLERMSNEIKFKQQGWQRMLVSHLLELTVLVQRSQSAAVSVPSMPEPPAPEYITQCCDYIAAHLQDDLSLQRIAKLFSVSAEHLTRSFRKEKGMTFYQYVIMQRVSASKTMLTKHTDISLTEIAYSLGFTSSTQFGRAFKRMTGATPSDYRIKSTYAESN